MKDAPGGFKFLPFKFGDIVDLQSTLNLAPVKMRMHAPR